MPFLDDLRQATTPVTITHGAVKFTLDCALEKESVTDAAKNTESTTYNELVAREYQIELHGQVLQQQIQTKISSLSELTDLDGFRKQLELERNSKLSARQLKAAEPITFEEIEVAANHRVDQFQTEVDALRVQIEQNNAALKHARAKQVAFLVASSDITAKDETPVLSNKVDKTPDELEADATIFASFSDALLEKCTKLVGGAIDGPLDRAG